MGMALRRPRGVSRTMDRQAATFAAPHDSRRKLCYAPRFISGTMHEIGRKSLISEQP
jgi:hypothetical protein